jgi:WhiB family transcriptional regulator, redox-sensing transcriptional regulator
VAASTLQEQTWQLDAACRGHDRSIFYPPSSAERRDERDRREARAKAICAECRVREECLEYSLAQRDQHGIWGGLTELERRALLVR